MNTNSSDESLIDRITGQDRAREKLDRLARKLRRQHHDAQERLRRQRAAEGAERNPTPRRPQEIRPEHE